MTDWTKPEAYVSGLDNVKPPKPSPPLRSLLWPRYYPRQIGKA